MKCPNCTLQIPDHAEFCAFCGDPIKRCIPCERVYAKQVGFCGVCGRALTQKVEPSFERKKALFETAPGHPGQRPDGAQPTFILPTKESDPDQLAYGYLYDPERPAHRFALLPGDNTLGAGHNNDIIIDRPAVSWNHALLICRNGKIFVQDSASTNGTFINRKRIDRPVQLQNGDALRFGNIDYHVWLKEQYR